MSDPTKHTAGRLRSKFSCDPHRRLSRLFIRRPPRKSAV